MTIRAIAFYWKNFAIVRRVITRIRPDTDISSHNIRSIICKSVTIHDFLFLVQDNNFHSHHHNKKSINVFQAVSAAFKNVSASVFYLYIGDILPSLKRMGFLDTNARNPDITIVGITLAFQFGNALPKYITGCKNITVVYRSARRAYPRAVA